MQEERSKVDDLRGTPMAVGTLEEIIDDNHAIVSTSVGSEYYVNMLSFVDKDLIEPGCTVLLNNKVISCIIYHILLSRGLGLYLFPALFRGVTKQGKPLFEGVFYLFHREAPQSVFLNYTHLIKITCVGLFPRPAGHICIHARCMQVKI